VKVEVGGWGWDRAMGREAVKADTSLGDWVGWEGCARAGSRGECGGCIGVRICAVASDCMENLAKYAIRARSETAPR
jgi:hypothetical protein